MKSTNTNQSFAVEPNTLIIEDATLQYGFIQLPKQILYARNLTRDAKILYAILLGYAWQELKCFPGYTRLCHDMMASENTVRKCMRELEAVSLLAQKRRGLGKTNIYLLRDIRTSKIEVQEPQVFEVQEPSQIEVPDPSRFEVYKETDDKETDEYLSINRLSDLSDFNVDNSGSNVDKPHRTASPSRARTQEAQQTQTTSSSVVQSDTGSAPRIPGEIQSVGAVLQRGRGRPPKETYDENRATIFAYIQDFARELGDNATTKASVTRAYNDFKASGRSIELFIDAMYQAKAKTQEYSASIRSKRADGDVWAPKAKMPYWFEILERDLGIERPNRPTVSQ